MKTVKKLVAINDSGVVPSQMLKISWRPNEQIKQKTLNKAEYKKDTFNNLIIFRLLWVA